MAAIRPDQSQECTNTKNGWMHIRAIGNVLYLHLFAPVGLHTHSGGLPSDLLDTRIRNTNQPTNQPPFFSFQPFFAAECPAANSVTQNLQAFPKSVETKNHPRPDLLLLASFSWSQLCNSPEVVIWVWSCSVL